MKIVIINGSARKGNTLAAINAFIKGASEQNILRLELIFFGNGADHLAGHPRSDDAGGNVMSDDASRPDNRACPDGNAAADGGICTDPDVFLQRNGCRGANAVAALLRVDGMTGAGKAYAGGNKGTCSDVYRRGIQNDAVIIDDRQAGGYSVLRNSDWKRWKNIRTSPPGTFLFFAMLFCGEKAWYTETDNSLFIYKGEY